jgi:hypothetical protein
MFKKIKKKMSWTLKVQVESSQRNLKKFLIREDDVMFYAILKRGHVEHFKSEETGNYQTRVRVLHLGNFKLEPNSHLVFYMSLLNSSTLEHHYPIFASQGLMGRWKLTSPPNSKDSMSCEPLVSLVQSFDKNNFQEFLACAQSKKNPEFIRSSYVHI